MIFRSIIEALTGMSRLANLHDNWSGRITYHDRHALFETLIVPNVFCNVQTCVPVRVQPMAWLSIVVFRNPGSDDRHSQF
ncbi:hypothetical protein J1614_003035 [Plenodomus biglobosus]|nr:hypothetical protein J1614_003035 [Plenodomus biglobosus]